MRNEIVLEKGNIVNAIRRLEQYHIHMEQSPGLIYDGEINREDGRRYIVTHGQGFPETEMLWIGKQGFGRRSGSDVWFKLLGKPFPDYMESALGLIRENIITSEREEGGFFVVDVVVNLNSDPEEVYRRFFKAILERLRVQDGDLLEMMVEISRDLSIIVQLWISREDYLIDRIQVHVLNLPFDAQLTVTFSQPQWEIPQLSAEEVKAATLEIPLSTLLYLKINKWGGWQQSASHSPWARRSLKLIKDKDTSKALGAYTELYHSYWQIPYKEKDKDKGIAQYFHPIEIGAYYEDESTLPQFYDDWFASDANYITNHSHYYTHGKYLRDNHHFGGQDLGLKYEWYFFVRSGTPPTTQPGNRYHSAKNWGYGGNNVPPSLNRLTFTEAIKQYNRYSLDGKRCAYLMLGHVLHLLQDQGNADHAKLVVHPASSYDEPGAYKEFYLCYLFAAEVAAITVTPELFLDIMMGNIGGVLAHSPLLLGAWPVFLIALAGCNGTIDANEVGYERLIGDEWKVEQRIGAAIDQTGVLFRGTYEDFFKDMAATSIAAHDKIQLQYPNFDLLDYPMGLGASKSIPSIPGLDPDIDKADKKQTEPFYKLTDIAVKDIVCYGAGFIERFYEIVDHPPFVEQVTVVKATAGLTPIAYAKFSPTLYLPKCQKCEVRYGARWYHQSGAPTRTLNVQSKPLSPDHSAYVFIQFGPNLGPGMSKKAKQETLMLNLVGTSPTNQPLNIQVQLFAAEDPQMGRYYWGSFQPTNPWGQKYELTLEIQAKDADAHFTDRTDPGDDLDSHPETVAMADPNNAPHYPFIGYQPGVDRNHKIEIGLPILKDALEDNQTIISATPVSLGVSNASLLYPDFETKQNPDQGATFYPDLTLHNATDVDFFHVHYHTNPHDKNMREGIVKELGAGLILESFAPVLEIVVQEAFGGCLTLKLYDSQTAQTHVFNDTTKASVKKPEDSFPNGELYLAVLNPDYAKQGKLRYGIFIRYISGGFTVHGKLLYKFWEYQGLPWPPPPEGIRFPVEVIWEPPIPPSAIKYYEPRQLISDLRGFLHKLADESGIDDQVERDIMLANECYELGQIAQGIGLLAEAEALYGESIKTYRQHDVNIKEAYALHDLQAIYVVQGRIDEANKITQRLNEILSETT